MKYDFFKSLKKDSIGYASGSIVVIVVKTAIGGNFITKLKGAPTELRKKMDDILAILNKLKEKLKKLGCKDIDLDNFVKKFGNNENFLTNFDTFDDVLQKNFIDDFAGADDLALDALNNDIKLIDTWKNIRKRQPITGNGGVKALKGNKKQIKYDPNGSISSTPPDNIDLFYENEAADILAKNGFDIEISPNTKNRTDGLDPNKDPDFKMNSSDGEFMDCFSPKNNTSARNIWSRAKDKFSAGQADKFVINLAQSNVDIDELIKQFKQWPHEGIQQVILIKKDKTILNILQ